MTAIQIWIIFIMITHFKIIIGMNNKNKSGFKPWIDLNRLPQDLPEQPQIEVDRFPQDLPEQPRINPNCFPQSLPEHLDQSTSSPLPVLTLGISVTQFSSENRNIKKPTRKELEGWLFRKPDKAWTYLRNHKHDTSKWIELCENVLKKWKNFDQLLTSLDCKPKTYDYQEVKYPISIKIEEYSNVEKIDMDFLRCKCKYLNNRELEIHRFCVVPHTNTSYVILIPYSHPRKQYRFMIVDDFQKNINVSFLHSGSRKRNIKDVST